MAYITKAEVLAVIGLPTDESIITNTDLDIHIASAESYVSRILGTKFEETTITSEVYDGTGTNVLFLKKYPVSSLDSVTIDGTSVTVGSIWLTASTGKLQLKSTAEKTIWDKNEPQLCVISYKYYESPDAMVKRYTAVMAGMMALVEQIGGTFDDVTSFSLPQMTGSLGEPYTNIREAIARMEKEEERMRPYMLIKPQFG